VDIHISQTIKMDKNNWIHTFFRDITFKLVHHTKWTQLLPPNLICFLNHLSTLFHYFFL